MTEILGCIMCIRGATIAEIDGKDPEAEGTTAENIDEDIEDGDMFRKMPCRVILAANQVELNFIIQVT